MTNKKTTRLNQEQEEMMQLRDAVGWGMWLCVRAFIWHAREALVSIPSTAKQNKKRDALNMSHNEVITFCSKLFCSCEN
jgi:hypothetical protein